jgi:uncharacterized membrane protein YebE (DUF533 family)
MKLHTATLTRFALAALLTAATGAFAQSNETPRVDQRQTNQQSRIDKGVASGQLSPQEAANLKKREDKIAANEAAAKADGKVTAKERAKLRHQQNVASNRIYNKKHNARTAANPTGAQPAAPAQ